MELDSKKLLLFFKKTMLKAEKLKRGLESVTLSKKHRKKTQDQLKKIRNRCIVSTFLLELQKTAIVFKSTF